MPWLSRTTISGSRLSTRRDPRGHLAHDSREHAVSLVDALAFELRGKRKELISGELAKPFGGLERRPPPYHALRSATSGNPQQRFWLVRAVFAGLPFATGCHGLRPLCSTNAP